MTNALQARPDITINLDKPRTFVIDWNAMRALEQRIGKKAVRAIDWDDPGFEDLTLIIWAGLLTDDPTVTVDHVGKYLNLKKLKEIEGVVSAAARAALMEEEAEPKNEEATKEAETTN